jgi:hypothetical protein
MPAKPGNVWVLRKPVGSAGLSSTLKTQTLYWLPQWAIVTVLSRNGGFSAHGIKKTGTGENLIDENLVVENLKIYQSPARFNV